MEGRKKLGAAGVRVTCGFLCDLIEVDLQAHSAEAALNSHLSGKTIKTAKQIEKHILKIS